MRSSQLTITPAVFQLFPQLSVGIAVVGQATNRGESGAVMAALRLEEARIAEQFGGNPVSEHPHIRPWREAYRAFGAKPKDYASSIENLLRRAATGYNLPHINTLVDLYNTISLRYLVPVGGEDLEHVQGDILLTRASQSEPAVRLLGEKDERPPHPGEVIYRDELGAICRRFNWKEADRTKLTEETRHAILVIEALPPVDEEMLRGALQDLSVSIQKHCAAEVAIHVLNASRPSSAM